jgi:hypothetical protein
VSPISYDLKGAAEATGLSESYLKRMVQDGELKSKRSNVDADGNPVGKYIIFATDLKAFVDGLVDA